MPGAKGLVEERLPTWPASKASDDLGRPSCLRTAGLIPWKYSGPLQSRPG